MLAAPTELRMLLILARLVSLVMLVGMTDSIALTEVRDLVLVRLVGLVSVGSPGKMANNAYIGSKNR